MTPLGVRRAASRLRLAFSDPSMPPPPRGLAPRPVRALVLVLPLVLLHGRGIAEVLIAVVAALFLLHSARQRDWRWLRTAWVQVGAVWWVWLVACSLPVAGLGQGGGRSLLQAVVLVRFLLFVAALEHWVLAGTIRPDRACPIDPARQRAAEAHWAATRRWLARLVALSGLYIALQCWLQALAGRNLWGWPRWGDGSLTGPYSQPRAGPPMSRLLFPAMLPTAARWMTRGRGWAAGALVLAGAVTVVLIGQRMPLLLTGLGLVVSGLLLPRLRRVVLACLVAAALLVPATAVLSPPTFGHLVTRFGQQMRHFPESDYGRIAVRALVIARANPWTGRGFDGYRTGCPDPSTFHALGGVAGDGGGDGGGGAPDICVQHPHNHYLQALTDAGLPGLLLFGLLVAAWLRALSRGLWRGSSRRGLRRRREPDAGRHALRVGLFVAALVQEWPLASASSFTSMPLSGWFFLLLGLGLAEARAYMSAEASGDPP
ncbi:MAG: O-antigen ligase family protein [Janthinobacterium lividum]